MNPYNVTGPSNFVAQVESIVSQRLKDPSCGWLEVYLRLSVLEWLR